MIAGSNFRRLIYSNIFRPRQGEPASGTACQQKQSRSSIFRCAAIGMFWLSQISGHAADMDQLLAQSEFVFKGTLQKLNATTVAAVPVNDKTIVVKVDEILQGSDALRAFLGQEVTVLLTEPATGKPGDQGIYFTKGWLYGESIALVEVGKLSAPQPTAAQPALIVQKEQVVNALERMGNRELRARLTTSDLVVTGKVTSVNPPKAVAAALRKMPQTEHDPQFLEATIQVERTEKGRLEGKTVKVVFPNSIDVMWHDAPKLKAGQEGTFILHSEEVKKVMGAVKVPRIYSLLNSNDFQPKGSEEQIRKIIQSIP